MKKNSFKKIDSFFFVKLFVFTLFFIYSVTLLAPFVWGFFMSLKTRVEYVTDRFTLFPKDWQWINYIKAWKELSVDDSNLILMTLNSLWYAIGIVVVTISISTCTAYVIAKYEFPGRRVLFTIAMLVQIVPIMGSFAAQIRVMMNIGFYDNPLVVIGLASALSSEFILLSSFFRGVSWEYAEAAFIDGAGHFEVFIKVMLPQAITPVLTLALTCFIGKWADGYSPLLYLPSFATLASGLYMYQIVSVRFLNWPVLFAGLLMAMVPILVLFFIFQRRILDLQFGGGLKG